MIAIKACGRIEADTDKMLRDSRAVLDANDAVRGAPKRDLVVVGASGGEGLEQIRALLLALPTDLDAAVLIVLHRPIDQPSRLKDVLARASRLPVRIAVQGEPLQTGVCCIGEPAEHLTVGARCTAALQHDCGLHNRTIDLLFDSAAATAGARVVGVILAGSLSDGAHGLAAIRDAGGAALVQDPRRVQYAGMPQAALDAVPEAEVFASPRQIARRLATLTGRSGLCSRAQA